MADDIEIYLVDHAGKIPVRRTAKDKLDPETRAELRIAEALAAGTTSALAPVSQLGFEVALDAMALNTKLALASDLDCYVDWCLSNRRTAFPADEETIVRYLDARSRTKAKPSTLARRVASISSAHSILGIDPEGPQSRMVRNKLKALRRKQGGRARQAEAIRFGKELSEETSPVTIAALLSFCDETLTGIRDAALLSTGYDAGLRVSELCAIEVAHLQLQSDSTGELFIPLSKTDQDGEGAFAWLSADTMRRLDKWLEAAEIKQGAVFRRVHVTHRKASEQAVSESLEATLGHAHSYQKRLARRAGKPSFSIYTPGSQPLTRHGVNRIYKRVIEQAWSAGVIDVPRHDIVGYLKKISSHSLRVGLTQDLIADGQDGVAISQALRWTSPSTALKYGARLKARSGATAKALSSIRK
jgi:site-specific recombinase XerD